MRFLIQRRVLHEFGNRIVTSEVRESALRPSVWRELRLARVWSPSKTVRKSSKKACQDFLRPINGLGNHTQTGKSVGASLAVPLQWPPSLKIHPHQ
jgi:hypothetical protein